MLSLVLSLTALTIALLALMLVVGSHCQTHRRLKTMLGDDDDEEVEEEQTNNDKSFKPSNGKKITIPKKLHFMYGLFEDDKEIPEEFSANLENWSVKNSDFEIELWTRERCETLLQEQFPEFQELYNSFTRRVQRADLMRYLVILHAGGFYFDLDCEPVDNVDLSSLSETGFVGFTEKVVAKEVGIRLARTEPIRQGTVEDPGPRIANFAFGAVPNHPLLRDIVDEVKTRCENNDTHPEYSDYEIMFTTGPDVFTHVVNRHDYDDVTILSKEDTDEAVQHNATGTWRNNLDEDFTKL